MSDDQTTKKKKERSPNHPTLTLGDAIEKVAVLHQKYGRHAAALSDALSSLNYNVKSSSGQQCVATLAAYGLVTITGKGDARKIAVSDAADRIIRNAPDRKDLIRSAAMAPQIHADVWGHYKGEGLPHDDILRTYLVWERPQGSRFTEEAVGPFIDRLKATLAYAGITGGDKITDEEEDGGESETPTLGDVVQWTSQGVDQFPEPRRIREISEDGQWALLEGSDTGVAMAELTKVDPPAVPDTTQKRMLSAPRSENPFKPKLKGPSINFPLSGDNSVELRLERRISRRDFERLKKLIDLSEDSLVEEDVEDI